MNIDYRNSTAERRDTVRDAARSKLEAATIVYCGLRVDDLALLVRATLPEADSIDFHLYEEDGWKVVVDRILDADENPLYDGRFQVATKTDGEDAIGTSWDDGEQAIQQILSDIADRCVTFLGEEPGQESNIPLDLTSSLTA